MSMFSDMYGSKYFSVADLQGKRRASDRQSRRCRTQGQGRDHQAAASCLLRRCREALVLNRTNARKLAETYTEDLHEMGGVVVDLYDEETSMGKGVRLRPVKRSPPAPLRRT